MDASETALQMARILPRISNVCHDISPLVRDMIIRDRLSMLWVIVATASFQIVKAWWHTIYFISFPSQTARGETRKLLARGYSKFAFHCRRYPQLEVGQLLLWWSQQRIGRSRATNCHIGKVQECNAVVCQRTWILKETLKLHRPWILEKFICYLRRSKTVWQNNMLGRLGSLSIGKLCSSYEPATLHVGEPLNSWGQSEQRVKETCWSAHQTIYVTYLRENRTESIRV